MPFRRRSLLGFASAAGALALGAWLIRDRRAVAVDLGTARELHGAAYAGSAACGTCHPEHAASWHRTFHRTMTQEARPETVAGDFANATYSYDGVTARMHRDAAGRFLMTFAPQAGGAGVDTVVVRAVGSRRYQQYLAEVDGALWRLPIAYHVEERRWFHMNGAFLTPDPTDREPDDASTELGSAERSHHGRVGEPSEDSRIDDGTRPRFGGGAYDRHVTRWNDNCVFCHNVAPNPGRDAATGAFATTVAELGVACEACHGPGAAHARANADPVRRYTLHATGAADPTIVNPSRLSPSRAADLCGRCHGQRMADDIAPFLAHGDPFVPGDDLGLYSAPLWRDTPRAGDRAAFSARFWEDGTPRLTAYEYQGLLESPCAQRGTLTCTSCHGMHDGDPRGQLRSEPQEGSAPRVMGSGGEAASAPGETAGADRADRICTNCHAALAVPAALAAHARHDPAGPGARCTGCHMPPIVYGVLDIHPSHRIEVPDPARDAAAGRPDACTTCHVESDRAWAVRQAARLWPGRFAGGKVPGDDHGAPRDALFAGDPIARAVAAEALGRAPVLAGAAAAPGLRRQRAQALLEALAHDCYPAVRHLAARALARVLGPVDPTAAATARGYDATGPTAGRARAAADITAALGGPPGTALDRARLAALRAEAARADIDIGE